MCFFIVGSITNHDARDVKINFSFLPAGNYTAEIYSDADDTDVNANDLNKKTINITNKDATTIKLAAGGGMVAIFR